MKIKLLITISIFILLSSNVFAWDCICRNDDTKIHKVFIKADNHTKTYTLKPNESITLEGIRKYFETKVVDISNGAKGSFPPFIADQNVWKGLAIIKGGKTF